MTTKPPKPDNPDQSKRFEDAAKQLGADKTDVESFERVIDAVVPPKPADAPARPSEKRSSE